MKDDEFEGDEQAQTPMKGDVAAPFGRLGCALVVCQISRSGIRKAALRPVWSINDQGCYHSQISIQG